MELTQEQHLIQDMMRKFASTELAPIASELDKDALFPQEILKKISELGCTGILIPEEYMGASLDPVSYCIIIEELSKALGSIGTILIVHNGLVSYPILKYGQETQKEQWLKLLAVGEIIGAFAFTEYEDSEISKLKTFAKRTDNGYIISGKKNFVPNADVAQLFIVFASTDEGVGAFIVERAQKGVKILDPSYTMGMRASGICDLELNEVQITEDKVLGNGKDGLNIFQDALALANIGIGAQAIGIAQASFDEALKYSRERHQFGRPICEFHLVQNMLVEMKMKIDSSRLLVYESARNSEKSDFHLQSSIAKVHAGRSAMYAGEKAVQIFGGYGYTKDYPVERYFRDAKFTQTWLIPSDFEKLKIANFLELNS